MVLSFSVSRLNRLSWEQLSVIANGFVTSDTIAFTRD